MAGILPLAKNPGDTPLANKVLCYVLTGFSTHFRVPVAYFFVKRLTGDQLVRLTLHVLEKVPILFMSIDILFPELLQQPADFGLAWLGLAPCKYARTHRAFITLKFIIIYWKFFFEKSNISSIRLRKNNFK